MLSLAACLAGACVALAAWILCGPELRVPRPERQDGLPSWWRALWPWTTVLADRCASALPAVWTAALGRQVARAALPACVGPAQLVALALVSALAAALASTWAAWQMAGAASGGLLAVPVLSALGAAWPFAWLGRQARRRRLRVAADLPFVLDMMTLCVESGLSLQAALQQAEHNGPVGSLRTELARALADMRTGMPRATALKALAERTDVPAVRAWVAALSQADALGMSLGPLMRGQAAQCRAERFQRAEKLAMEAPVKMLLPLIGCIFPCTFIVLGFPIALELLGMGV